MSVLSISRDWGVSPAIVRMVVDDSLSDITTSGYLTDPDIAADIIALNSGEFTWLDSDVILIKYDLNWDFFYRDASTEAFVGLPGPGGISSTLPSGEIIVGNGANVATAVAMSGDIAISNAGVTSIAAGAIVNADVNAAAAIDYSKLAALPSGDILVGSAGNVATAVTMSGDATIIASGALTIANDAITTAKILNANVTLAKLAAGITPSHIIKFANQVTTVGGAAAEAFTVTGAVGATDRAFVQVVDDGSSNVTVLQAVVTDNTLTVTFSANPGNDTIINYQIIRAAA